MKLLEFLENIQTLVNENPEFMQDYRETDEEIPEDEILKPNSICVN